MEELSLTGSRSAKAWIKNGRRRRPRLTIYLAELASAASQQALSGEERRAGARNFGGRLRAVQTLSSTS
jgi:hypothetical protein